jgi:hypothetical protein
MSNIIAIMTPIAGIVSFAAYPVSIPHLLLRDDGRIVVDGIVVTPTDALFMSRGKVTREIDEEGLVAQEYIDTLVGYSAGINRKIARGAICQHKSGAPDSSFADFFRDPGDEVWQRERYPAAFEGGYCNNTVLQDMEWVDGLSDRHDPEAIRRELVAVKRKNRQFALSDGYLHVEEGAHQTARLESALRNYRALGGMLGKSSLEYIQEEIKR